VVAAALVCLLCCGSDFCKEAGQSTIVVEWNNVALSAVRRTNIGPPMVARALAIVHTCMYDAWAAYNGRAMGTQFGDRLRRPKRDRTIANQRIAISYAAYRALVDLFPNTKKTVLDHFMITNLGLDPTNQSRDTSSPIGVANAACDVVLAARHRDGSNQLGDLSGDGVAYSDYTHYVPVNPESDAPVKPASVTNPDRFQPLQYKYEWVRAFLTGPFLGAQWHKVVPFAGPYDEQIRRVASEFPVIKFGAEQFGDQIRELVDISANLTDQQKMISEYWTDGPNSELPAGHWCLFAQFISARDHHTLDDDVKLFFALTNAVLDSGIAAWTMKRQFDSVRPVTAVPYLLRGTLIKSWGGLGKGTVSMDGSEWLPYQPPAFLSPPFPEYPSGHSAFSAAAATILQLWTHSDAFGDSVSLAAGSSRIEPGTTPKIEVVLEWPTFTDAANQAGMSRRYGGIHFQEGDLAGRALGRLVAQSVWKRAQRYFRQ
jgi:hypothetical protein